ncbi:MAG TPA: methylmalonyl-CoA epimerase [Rectinema sp.]|nr:methylmalonyl-CoA epimerase [Rectinema sp.]HOR48831.1 methylmalonyl-CoA epimerase [Rectinema sp.]HPL71922.1 methylmalonyl-CoA epimerase [Rectinema sp.]HQB07408.1 methylmalonyl-CoA epimerase [Rectinema sp.]
MKALKIDHIGIAVEKIDTALSVWEATLGLPLNAIEEVLDQKVKTAFMPIGDTEIELLESTDPEGPIGKFIATKGQGVHHLAFRVENIDKVLSELKAKGVRLIDEEPRYGAGGARIAFIHPKATGGVLVELCERT